MLVDLYTRFEPMQAALVSGGRLHLDAGSAITDNTDSDTRAVTLLQGAAFFDVAKNPRPFEVMVGDLRVRVRGTAFETAWIDDVIEISVSEGRDGAVAAQAEFVSQNVQDDGFCDLGTLRIGAPEAQALLGNDTITEEEIEQRNPSSIRDVFDGESAVTTGGGAAIANKVFVNGIEESLLSVTIDGAR
ncbi:FecR domain-containing protein [uncultured Roseovarius sp.]|uniref:FecR domain-containing protein n=1 Tax=uncultured Roseovarius sp. TaxID=293344 RepID=UPI002601C946|nr:FecR domain-containing protein [uncultured Roseovarius sp.]